MPVTVTTPARGTLWVRGMPFEGRGVGYAIIKAIIGDSARVTFSDGAFRASRGHSANLIAGLACRYGSVDVVHHGRYTVRS